MGATRDNVRPDPYGSPPLSPLYEPPPFEYRDSWTMLVVFRTDPRVLGDLVPPPLVASDSATMWVTVNRMFATGFGHYQEFVLGALATYQGRTVNYCVYLVLDCDIAIAAGREIWGFPKKYGRVDLVERDGVLVGTVERGGMTLVRAAVQISDRGRAEDLATSLEYVNLKLIPSVKRNALPDVKQLTSTTAQNMVIKNVFKGRASLEFGVSPADRLSEVPVLEVLGGFYYQFDATLPDGEVLHDYLKHKGR